MNMISGRAVVYAKDVMNITGRSKTFSYDLIIKIKKSNGRDKRSFVGIRDFCEYTGLEEKEVLKFIQ